MRMPFKASTRLAAPLILATASLSLLALHCSSDTGGQTLGASGTFTTTSGAGGAAAQGGSTIGGMTTGGITSAGTASAGFPTGGVTTGGATTGGAGGTAGASGASGAGGSAGGGGAAGSSGSGGAGGAAGVTFAQVKDLLSKTCAGAKCHNPESDQMDWITDTAGDSLYTRLTSPIPANTTASLCLGKTPVVKNMPPDQSLIIQAVKGAMPQCDKKGGGTENLAKMPDKCPQNNVPCLTDMQIKLLSDWIAEGAPM